MFVDIGAHDGVSFNNSLFFEKSLEWTGICIEPNPDVYAQLRENRDCVCVQGCIFSKKKVVDFMKISGYAEMLSGIIENYDPLHVQRIQKEIRSEGGKC